MVHYALMGNHAHLIVEGADRQALGRGMKAVGARLARAVNRVFDRRGPVLKDRYHLRVLETPREVRGAIRYVLLNAARHARRAGRGGRALRIDPASSGRWFDGWRRGKVERERAAAAQPSVTRPRTWLLRRGWRRHGLLDPAEVPGGARASP